MAIERDRFSMTSVRAARVGAVALIAAVSIAAHAASIHGTFISDDIATVEKNSQLDSLAPSNVGAILTSFDGPNYGPLKVLSLAIDRQLFGRAPTGHHVVNIVMHAANAIALFALLLRLGLGPGVALVAALLWAVHPVQVESVAWISERKNVLSTLFFFLALHAYLTVSERPRPSTYALVVVLFTAAVFSKINTIVLPAITVAYEIVFRGRLRRRDVVLAALLLAIGAVPAWVNLAGNPVLGATYHANSFVVTMRTSATVVPRYLALILAPVSLSTAYRVPLRASWLDPAVAFSVALIAALVVTTILLALRRRHAAFWLAWFGITLSPMLNLVPFPALMADRYLYVALVGPVVLIVEGAARLAARMPCARRVRAPRPLVAVAAAAVVAACATLTIARVPVWRDPFSMWAGWAVRMPYMTVDIPNRPPPRTAEQRVLEEALASHPDRAALHNNIGGIAFEEARFDDALTSLLRARALDPDDPVIALNLGRALLWSKRPAEAVPVLEDAARIDPFSFYALLNLARAHLVLGHPADARRALERARVIVPERRAWEREWTALERMEGR